MLALAAEGSCIEDRILSKLLAAIAVLCRIKLAIAGGFKCRC